MKLTLFLAWLHILASHAQKKKRVINGLPVHTRDNGYEVFKYFVWISNAHECDVPMPEFMKRWFKLDDNLDIEIIFRGYWQCQPRPKNLKCSGALITPLIVQTACHCLADFASKGDKKNMHASESRSVWETMFRSYVGFKEVSEMKVGIPPSEYFVHQKCAQYGRVHVLVHDYAWISLSFGIDEFNYFKRMPYIGYAPTYTIKELLNLWRRTNIHQIVCLYVGGGNYKKLGYNEVDEASPDILHGWRVAQPNQACYSATAIILKNFNFTEDATWTCTKSFPYSLSFIPGRGDSGGPVTCDNHYTELVSHGQFLRSDPIAVDMALVFAVFENSVEYRRSFMEAIRDSDTHAREQSPTFLPTPIEGR